MRPQMAFRSLPMCVNIERQATDEPQGRALRAFADQLQSRPGLLSVSCLYGFPYADVPEMGATVLAVSERDRSLAEDSAAQMAAHWWEQRELFRGRLLSIDEALHAAADVRRQDASRPVGLLDMGDNVGGGGPGDATEIVHRWRMSALRHSGRLLIVLADPVVVEQAFGAELGARLVTSVGGRMDPARHAPPFEDTFIVSRLSDGRFEEPEVRHGGYRFFDQGPTVVLDGVSGVTVIATTQRVAPLSLQQVVSQGLTPEEFAAIVIKGEHAPVAAYRQACSKLIRVNSPGVTSADLCTVHFSKSTAADGAVGKRAGRMVTGLRNAPECDTRWSTPAARKRWPEFQFWLVQWADPNSGLRRAGSEGPKYGNGNTGTSLMAVRTRGLA
jgi:microcystin degradation protein MlrC